MAESVSEYVQRESERCLAAYAVNPRLIREHAGIEAGIIYGGYGDRQIYELIQNGADAMLRTPGHIELVLTDNALYCANEGTPIDCAGVDVLLSSSISNKRGDEIGRFGMGFKSVLGLTESPAFFSKSGSFRFSRELAERRIRPVCADGLRLPILRIAEPLDTDQCVLEDEVLRSLSRWASTIVRLPFAHAPEWLLTSFRNFPAEFLLFAPHVRRLTLIDQRQGGLRREIEAEPMAANEVLIAEGQRLATWKVFSTVLSPSDEALSDAGERAGRNKVPITWAVPSVRQEQLGTFWSFFPTTLRTSLSGILNAPWKTNEDRLNLLPGHFNNELLASAAELVLKSLPELLRLEDPGALLDVLPGRESRGWADERLAMEIYKRAAQARIVADQDGNLEKIGNLRLPPEGMPEAVLDTWNSAAVRPKGWTHVTLETSQRRSRLERLYPGKSAATGVSHWLEALVMDNDHAEPVVALRCAAVLCREARWEEHVRQARIIPSQAGEWVLPISGRVFLPAGYDPVSDETEFVRRDIAEDPQARVALLQLGIREASPLAELNAMLLEGVSEFSDLEWRHFWQVAEAVGEAGVTTLQVAAQEGSLRVATRAGAFQVLRCTLLPGDVVVSEEDDSKVMIDTEAHAGHLDLLRAVGAVAAPHAEYPLHAGLVMEAFRRAAVDQYKAKIKSLPQDKSALQFQRRFGVGPLDVFDHLSESAQQRFTEAALRFDPESWHLRNTRVPKTQPLLLDSSPCTWLLRKRGVVRTSQGLRRVTEAVSSRLTQLSPYLPVAELTEELSDRLNLPTTVKLARVQEVMAAWQEDESRESPTALYAYAAGNGVLAPAQLRCYVDDKTAVRRRHEVELITEADLTSAPAAEGCAYLPATAEQAKVLAKAWDMDVRQTVNDVFQIEVEPGDPGSAVPLYDRFPALRGHTADPLVLVSCTSLIVRELTTEGATAEPRWWVREAGTMFYLESLDEDELWDRVCENLQPPLDLLLQHSLRPTRAHGAGEEGLALMGGSRASDEAVREAVRTACSDADKLLAAVGPESLRRRLPSGLLDTLAQERSVASLSPRELAEVALAVHGADVLAAFRVELENAGLQTPSTWAGSVRSRDFVKSLGFSESFAGLAAPAREALVPVQGRRRLPKLHDYQRVVVDEMQRLFVGDGGYRALLSLPTGAGKTRVSVEGLIRGIVSGVLHKPILWVAPQDELCEQAVQTWREAWPVLGNDKTIYLSRLWGNNRITRVDGLQVVIATIAKLEWVFEDGTYDWLRELGALVIDEAHASITPMYTALLQWAGYGRIREKDPAPLLALSATPERGNEAESRRLVERYNARRLDRDAFGGKDAHEELQAMGVLARVKQECICGTALQPAASDRERFRTFKRLTPEFEERIGRDKTRNRTILASIAEKPSDWPILVFATSVEHAELLAALLTLSGVSAACITGQTPAAARADAIARFRNGSLRVLTNYSVLAQGFDAPAVRALYVTRPTFSANLYQQMIGRGLRGPKNGGKEECLIVNVDDNIEMYGEILAFRRFGYLWDDPTWTAPRDA